MTAEGTAQSSAFELARQLLHDPDRYSADQLQAMLDSGQPRQVVRIERDIDVLLMYWTVSPASAERLQFHRDIYDLDGAALAALDTPPVVG